MPAIFHSPACRSDDEWEWQLRAKCRTVDPSLFFHPDGERGHARQERQKRAKQVCADCPVADQCRDHAIVFQEAFGTWGGMSEEDRARSLFARKVHIRTHRPAPSKDHG
ncbi:WhiB family transcriptional regulator [Mycobacterium sp. 155]|uniref:WhiB family transcriptional regulator n=1 Tax=Mycobacterium sp. 155 TaxID=1157943 RepID=UPI0009DB0C01|nr:WhiB family transcriptional regulator [Mycobacterium sp. 155]